MEGDFSGLKSLRQQASKARQFNRSFVLPILILQFWTIIIIVTAWVVTDTNDDEVLEILYWQFFHGFTLVAVIAMITFYVMMNRSMKVIVNHENFMVDPEPPSNFLWGVFALQILAFVVAVFLFFGQLFIFNPTNNGASSLVDRVHIYFLIINVIAALVAVFAVIVLMLLRSRIATFWSIRAAMVRVTKSESYYAADSYNPTF